ncbi:MAG: carboxypeptidase-like regulatory domain-containing protein [Candidatus Sumerlaeota bacterium]|nr:carboxypeptidase-like regulatory domain-containing protein [Candidatus Sumerlaeota bacterium]
MTSRNKRGRASAPLIGAILFLAIVAGVIVYIMQRGRQESGSGAGASSRLPGASSANNAPPSTSSTSSTIVHSVHSPANAASAKPGANQGIIYGKTLFEDGRPAPGALVSIRDRSGDYTSSTVAGDFELRCLATQNLQIVASLGPYISYQREGEAPYIELKAGRRSGPHNLTLKRGLTLSGVVHNLETAQPIGDAGVYSFRVTDASSVSSESVVATTQTSADGVYQIEGCPSGPLLLLFGAKGFADKIVRAQIAAGRKNLCDVSLELEGKVLAHVNLTSGAAIADARLTFDSEHSYLELRHGEVKTSADGGAMLEGVSVVTPPKISAEKEGYIMEGGGAAMPLFPRGSHFAEIKLVMKPDPFRDKKAQPASQRPRITKTVAFTGLVTDASSMPIFGARVYWQSPAVAGSAEPALTGPDGRYRLTPLIALNAEPDPEKLQKILKEQGQNCSLAVVAQGYVPALRRGITPGTPDEPREVDFTLEAGHWAGGQVVNPKGEPIPAVEINFQSLNKAPGIPHPSELPDWQPLRTTADGRFRIENLPNAKLSVSLSAKGWSDEKDKIIPLDRETQIVMRGGAVIKGRIEDKETGAPIRNFRIHYDGADHSEDRAMIGTQFTSEDGRFVLDDLQQDGCYFIAIVAQGYSTSFDFDLVAQEESKAKEKPFKLSKGTDLTGIVVDGGTGKPIERARVMYVSTFLVALAGDDLLLRSFDDNLPDLPGILQKNFTGPDGAFAFNETEELGSVGVMAEGYASLTVRPNERAKYGGGRQLRIPLGSGGRVSGFVTFDGSGLENANLTLAPKEDEDNVFQRPRKSDNSAKSGTKGAYDFENVAAGQYSLTISHSDKNAIIESRRVFALADNEQKDFNIEIKKGPAALSGRVLNGQTPVAGADINITQKTKGAAGESDSLSYNTKSDAQGAYRIEGANETKYSVAANGKVGGKNMNCKPEEIEIKGETQHDFQLGAPNKVTARLVFCGAGDSAKAPQLGEATLTIKNAESAPYSKDWDNNGRTQNLKNNQAIFTGRFQGDYFMTISGQVPGGGSFSIKNIGPLALNNLSGDQDLGDVAVPGLGTSSLKGLVMDTLGSPIKGAFISLSSPDDPANPGFSMSVSSDVEGHYEIVGLGDGDYWASVSRKRNRQGSIGDNEEKMEVTEKIAINGATDHDFILMSGNKVTLRFVLPKNSSSYSLSDFRKVAICLMGEEGPQKENPVQITHDAESVIIRSATAFSGRFLGQYAVTLEYGEKPVWLPQILSLDNIDQDQDAGEIQIPELGIARVALAFAPSEAPKPQQITALVDFTGSDAGSGAGTPGSAGDSGKAGAAKFSLDPDKPLQAIGPFCEGAHKVVLKAPVWTCAPPIAAFTIKSGEPPVIRFTLTPISQ